MKKIILGFLIAFSSLFAADVVGVIENIDQANKTITVNGSLIKVLPYTKIEKDTCWGIDLSSNFTKLKVGDFVEVDTMINQNILVAEEIEIECNSNRAY